MLVVLLYHSLLVCRVEMHEFPQKFPEWSRWSAGITSSMRTSNPISVIHTEHLYIKLEIRDHIFYLSILETDYYGPIYFFTGCCLDHSEFLILFLFSLSDFLLGYVK